MDYGLAVPVELDVWKDPQCFVITEHIRDEAWVWFQCWSSPGKPADYVGCLHFEGVWHIESTRHLQERSYPNVMSNEFISCYLTVEKSSLVSRLKQQRSEHDKNWAAYDRRSYSHYIVENHDFLVHIIASDVRFSTVENHKVCYLINRWETV